MLILLINVLETLFCVVSKRLSQKEIVNDIEEGKKDTDKYTGSDIVRGVYSLANSFTFLYFKLIGYIPSHHIRKFLYKYVFRMSIGKDTVIYYGLEARKPWNITIGDHCSIGDKVILDARRPIVFGDNVNVSTGAWFWTVQHDINSRTFGTEGNAKSIRVGDRAWISSRTTILPGCDIEEGVVVAAGASVTKPCDIKFSVYGGVPAKKISERDVCVDYELNNKRYRHFI